MQWPRAVTDQLDRVIAAHPLDPSIDEGRLNALSGTLASLDTELREQIQAATAAQVAPLITALQADGPVEPDDLDLIQLWLVGDAEYYLKMENDFPAWIAELNRLIGVLRDLRSEAVTPTTMSRVEATVRDALRVSADIVFYRQQEERVRSFQNAAKDLSRDDKRMIADLLAASRRASPSVARSSFRGRPPGRYLDDRSECVQPCRVRDAEVGPSMA